MHLRVEKSGMCKRSGRSTEFGTGTKVVKLGTAKASHRDHPSMVIVVISLTGAQFTPRQ